MSGISPDVRAEVLELDGFRCLAPQLDRNAGWCKDRWGHLITRWTGRDPGGDKLELHHVKEANKQMMGRKAPTDIHHLIPLCPWHHQGLEAGACWATKRENLALMRRHLEKNR